MNHLPEQVSISQAIKKSKTKVSWPLPSSYQPDSLQYKNAVNRSMMQQIGSKLFLLIHPQQEV